MRLGIADMDATTLRAWRDARGLTRYEAGAMLAISWRTLETLEAGKSPTSALWGPIGRIIELLDRVAA